MKKIHLLFILSILSGCNKGASTSNVNDGDEPILITPSEPLYVSISSKVTGSGYVAPKEAKIEKGHSTSFKVVPNPGYHIGSIEGCGGELISDTFNVNNVKESCIFNVGFAKSKVEHSYQFTDESVIDIDLSDLNSNKLEQVLLNQVSSTPIAKTDSFSFSDVSILLRDNTLTVTNNTPEYLDKMTVSVGKDKIPQLINFNPRIEPYTNSEYLAPGIDTIRSHDLMPLYQSQFTFLGDNPDCSILPWPCYQTPTEKERQAYEGHLVNHRNAINSVKFTSVIHNYVDNTCTHSQCVNIDGEILYADRRFLELAGQDHELDLMTLYENGSSTGVGGGSVPSKKYGKSVSYIGSSETGGFASMKQYALADPWTKAQHELVLHEIIHGHGMSHDSGMTYGFQNEYYREFILGQPSEEVENIGNKKVPNVVYNTKVINDKDLELTIYTIENSQNISLRLMSPDYKELSGKLTWDNIDNKIRLSFDEHSDSVIYIMLYDDSENALYSTIKILPSDLYVKDSFSTENFDFFELPKELIPKDRVHWTNLSACAALSRQSRLATLSEYQEIWSMLKASNNLDKLQHTRYLTARDSVSGDMWYVELGDSFTSKLTGGNQFMSNKGLLCVDPHS